MVERANSRLWYSPARPQHLLPPKNSCCRSCSIKIVDDDAAGFVEDIGDQRDLGTALYRPFGKIVEGPSPSHSIRKRRAGLRMIIARDGTCLSLQERSRLPENADTSLVAGRHVVGAEGSSVDIAHLEELRPSAGLGDTRQRSVAKSTVHCSHRRDMQHVSAAAGRMPSASSISYFGMGEPWCCAISH